MKYVDTLVTFSEIPDEITLAINISGCKNACPGCHSPYLAEDIGKPLTETSLSLLINNNKGITCVCLMGGDANPMYINQLAEMIRGEFADIKVAWYSGKQELSEYIELKNFDYIKLGPYIEEKGPLNNPNTNQRLYDVCRLSKLPDKFMLKDITNKFWK